MPKTKKVLKESDMQESADALAENPVQIEGGRLTHDETIRGSALAIACRYYTETIVKDGDLYREMMRDNRVLKPATYIGVLEVAISFEAFLRGDLKRTADAIVEEETKEPLAEIDSSRPTPKGEQESGK
jgi:hypothetical protein